MTVNDLEDYARFREAIKKRKTVAIVGAGLIGCEFAQDLSSVGYKVEVIDVASQPLPRLLPPEGGAMMRAKLEATGTLGTWAPASCHSTPTARRPVSRLPTATCSRLMSCFRDWTAAPD